MAKREAVILRGMADSTVKLGWDVSLFMSLRNFDVGGYGLLMGEELCMCTMSSIGILNPPYAKAFVGNFSSMKA